MSSSDPLTPSLLNFSLLHIYFVAHHSSLLTLHHVGIFEFIQKKVLTDPECMDMKKESSRTLRTNTPYIRPHDFCFFTCASQNLFIVFLCSYRITETSHNEHFFTFPFFTSSAPAKSSPPLHLPLHFPLSNHSTPPQSPLLSSHLLTCLSFSYLLTSPLISSPNLYYLLFSSLLPLLTSSLLSQARRASPRWVPGSPLSSSPSPRISVILLPLS